MKKFYSFAFLCASLFCALAIPARGQDSAIANLPEVPLAMTLKGADGKAHDLSSMLGQIVLVSFGATWCQPCQEELKALEQLKKEYKDKGVRFFWVSIEGEDDVSNSALRNYAKKLKISFPVLRDPDKSTFARFSTRMRLPTILFFGRDGKLSLPNHEGITAIPRYMADLRARLDKLVAMEAMTDSTDR